MPAGSRRCSPGSARCAATSSSMPPGAVSGHHSTRGSPPPIPCLDCSRPRTCGPSPAPSSTPPPATTATSCTSASPIWDGTYGPGTRLISPLRPGVSPRSSSAAPCLWHLSHAVPSADEAALVGRDDGLDAVPGAELGQHVAYVGLERPLGRPAERDHGR